MNKSKYIALFFILLSINSFSQEFLQGLDINPEIIEAQSKKKSFEKANMISDTLFLPFFDDFSGKSVYPDQCRWVDNNVYINSRYGILPPSIGVATFDAIDSHGTIYKNAKLTPFGADTLTSKPIFLGPDYSIKVNGETYNGISIENLYFYNTCQSAFQSMKDSIFIRENDSTYNIAYELNLYNLTDSIYYKCDSVQTLINDSLYYYIIDSSNYYYLPRSDASRRLWTQQDSVVLSFYYEPQGLGDVPEENDSLKLEFYAPEEGKWHYYYSIPGDTSTSFRLLTLPITNPIYLNKGFQFRFINFASINTKIVGIEMSNADIWNIDYIYLDKKRRSDTIFFNDIAQVTPLGSFLKNYESIPWKHYINSSANISERKSSFSATIRNLNPDEKGPRRIMILKDYDKDSVLSESGEIATPINGLEVKAIEYNDFPLVFNLDDSKETANFELQAVIHNDDSLEIRDNDTISHIQRFTNYYSYDDGSAESGYYLSGQGTLNAKGAMYFSFFLTDTLKAVQFYFNQSFDSTNYVPFNIAIWKDTTSASLISEPGKLIYEFDEQQPQFKGINQFAEYVVPQDTLIILPQRVWIGWIQTTEDVLDIGFDMNNNKKDNIKFNINGDWENTSFNGTLMIRPVFGKLLPLKIKRNIMDKKPEFSLFPNPASELINIIPSMNLENSDLIYQVYNGMGQLIFSSEYYTEQINVQDWKNGFYFIKISDSKTFNITKKIIVSH